MIYKCKDKDAKTIVEVINDAALAYNSIIPPECYHEPYTSLDQLKEEISQGIVFWGYKEKRKLVGVMGIQQAGDATLIRHAYVRTDYRNRGIGGALLTHLRNQTTLPILIGTWAQASWAIKFYQKHGFHLVSQEEKDHLLRKYWQITDTHRINSVVLADQSFMSL